MYTIMIVDDEPLMLKYLGGNISRIASDWCVTGLASDGLQAVELLQRQNFDLIITDIKMPGMDGLELAKFVYEIYPQTQVVIISGFDDFEYARRAIRCGVSDYLLKPLSDENIAEALKKAAAIIIGKDSNKFSDQMVNKMESLTDAELKSDFLNAIIQGNSANIKSMYSTIKKRNISIMEHYACIMTLCVDSAYLLSLGNDYQKIVSEQMWLNQKCMETFQRNSNVIVCYCDFNNTALLVCEKAKNSVEQSAHSIFDEIAYLFEKEFQVKLLGSYGTTVANFLDLQKSYQTSSQSLMLSFVEENSPISPISFISQKTFLNGVNALISSIYSDFISLNESRMRADLSSFFSLSSKLTDQFAPVRLGIYLLYSISQKSKMKEEQLEKAFQQLSVSLNDTSLILTEKNIIDIFFKSVLALNKDNGFQSKEENSQLVDEAKEYIYSHYSEPISLTLVAEKLGVSSSYLSDLFHKEIGEPYSKFITRVRMEQATTLMRANPGEKIYTLAIQVGFVNAKHFNSVFKKFYNKTPTEFIQTMRL